MTRGGEGRRTRTCIGGLASFVYQPPGSVLETESSTGAGRASLCAYSCRYGHEAPGGGRSAVLCDLGSIPIPPPMKRKLRCDLDAETDSG